MKNVEMTVDGDLLTIKVDLSKEFGPSSTGKTIIIASTEGNQLVPGNEEIKIGLNVYKKKWLIFNSRLYNSYYSEVIINNLSIISVLWEKISYIDILLYNMFI